MFRVAPTGMLIKLSNRVLHLTGDRALMAVGAFCIIFNLNLLDGRQGMFTMYGWARSKLAKVVFLHLASHRSKMEQCWHSPITAHTEVTYIYIGKIKPALVHIWLCVCLAPSRNLYQFQLSVNWTIGKEAVEFEFESNFNIFTRRYIWRCKLQTDGRFASDWIRRN